MFRYRYHQAVMQVYKLARSYGNIPVLYVFMIITLSACFMCEQQRLVGFADHKGLINSRLKEITERRFLSLLFCSDNTRDRDVNINNIQWRFDVSIHVIQHAISEITKLWHQETDYNLVLRTRDCADQRRHTLPSEGFQAWQPYMISHYLSLRVEQPAIQSVDSPIHWLGHISLFWSNGVTVPPGKCQCQCLSASDWKWSWELNCCSVDVHNEAKVTTCTNVEIRIGLYINVFNGSQKCIIQSILNIILTFFIQRFITSNLVTNISYTWNRSRCLTSECNLQTGHPDSLKQMFETQTKSK